MTFAKLLRGQICKCVRDVCMCLYSIHSTRLRCSTQCVIAGLVAVLRPVINIAWPGPNPSSETDRGQFNDREYSKITMVIYSKTISEDDKGMSVSAMSSWTLYRLEPNPRKKTTSARACIPCRQTDLSQLRRLRSNLALLCLLGTASLKAARLLKQLANCC